MCISTNKDIGKPISKVNMKNNTAPLGDNKSLKHCISGGV